MTMITFRRNKYSQAYHIAQDKKIITVLPGSRKNEVAKLLPVFLEAAKELKAVDENLFFVIPTVRTVAENVKKQVQQSGLPILVVETQADRYGAFRASSAAALSFC